MAFPVGHKSHMLAKTPEERAELNSFDEHNSIRCQEVFLTRQEFAQAAYTGALRYVVTCGETFEKRRVCNDEPARIGRGLMQAVACAAVAKSLGVYWLGQWGHPGTEDIVGPLDVHYSLPGGHYLFLPPDASSERAHCLVTGWAPRLMIQGCIDGHLAMSPRFTVVDEDHPEKGSYQRIEHDTLIPWKLWVAQYLVARNEALRKEIDGDASDS